MCVFVAAGLYGLVRQGYKVGWTVTVSSVSSEMVLALHVSELVEHDNVTLA